VKIYCNNFDTRIFLRKRRYKDLDDGIDVRRISLIQAVLSSIDNSRRQHNKVRYYRTKNAYLFNTEVRRLHCTSYSHKI